MKIDRGGPGANDIVSSKLCTAAATLAVMSVLAGCAMTPAPVQASTEQSTALFVRQLCSQPEPSRSLTLVELNRQILPATVRVDCMD